QRWLNLNLRDQPINPEAHQALRFLQKQAHLDHTDYPRFKREGIEVIGSGQIEGANKGYDPLNLDDTFDVSCRDQEVQMKKPKAVAPQVKFQAALEAVKGERSLVELARAYAV
ncbi:hypothetical protein DNA98_17565, partial [Meiothermus sp. Pnk-1]